MNANELADLYDAPYEYPEWGSKAQAMLRQQQAEIEALKAKTLTDEEIESCWDFYTYCPKWAIDFARAILRKVQEK